MQENRQFEGFVHVEGGLVRDGRGEPLLLTGVGLGNWLLPEGYMWKFEPPGPQSARDIEALTVDLVGPRRAAVFWERFRNEFVTEDDIRLIAAEGMNHVRLPINARAFYPGDTFDPAGFTLIDRTIDWCRRQGLWVILDLHGAPGGQTGTNIDDSPNGIPELFTNAAYWAQCVELWAAMAARYANEPVVAAYDLLNEPLPDEYQHLHADKLVELYLELTAVIRAVDPHHMITYEGMHWSTNWDIFDRVWDANSLLQFHKYWSPPDIATIQKFLDAGRELGLPIYMGEGGENNPDWLHSAFQMYEDHGISWNFWPWKKVETLTSPYSVIAPDGWYDIVDYAAGKVPKPDPDEAWRCLQQLLDAMAVDQCDHRPEVIAALLRRAPLRIPATSFVVTGASQLPGEPRVVTNEFRAESAVAIQHATTAPMQWSHNHGRPRLPDEELFVVLHEGDWASYEVNVATPSVLTFTVHAAATGTGTAGCASL